MRYVFSLLLILVSVQAYGLSTAIQAVVSAGGTAPSCGAGTELVCENFDGSSDCGPGTDTNCNITWTEYGTSMIDFNNATSPAPLDGTYSAYSPGGDSSAGIVKSFTAQDTVHFFYIMNAQARTTGTNSFTLLDSGDNIIVRVYNAGYEFAMMCGATVWAYSTTMSADTNYYVWGDYTKGTGANAVCHLFHSTDAIKGSADITITNGDATAQVSKVRITEGDETLWDKIRVGTSAFGDNPT